MESHSSHKPVTSLLIILILGVIILGVLVALQNREIHRLSEDQKVADEQPSQPATPVAVVPDQPTGPTQKTGTGLLVHEWTLVDMKVTHYCDGTLNTIEGGTNFCIGKNTLVFSQGTRTKTIATVTATEAQAAPLLLDVAPVESNLGLDRLLVAFSKDSCATTQDCGAGMPTNYYNYVVNIGDLTIRTITNYPGSGKAIWNSAGTKALFVTDTCGGAGCSETAVIGYDLDHDTVKAATKEQAVGFIEEPSTSGKYSYWSAIHWVTDSKFSATIVGPDGKTKTITGTF